MAKAPPGKWSVDGIKLRSVEHLQMGPWVRVFFVQCTSTPVRVRMLGYVFKRKGNYELPEIDRRNL